MQWKHCQKYFEPTEDLNKSHLKKKFRRKSKCFWDYRNFPHSTDPEINIKNRNAHRILFAVGCLECELELLLELKLTQEMLEVRTSVRANNNSRNVITFFAKKTFSAEYNWTTLPSRMWPKCKRQIVSERYLQIWERWTWDGLGWTGPGAAWMDRKTNKPRVKLAKWPFGKKNFALKSDRKILKDRKSTKSKNCGNPRRKFCYS